jgi:hypothetical protein
VLKSLHPCRIGQAGYRLAAVLLGGTNVSNVSKDKGPGTLSLQRRGGVRERHMRHAQSRHAAMLGEQPWAEDQSAAE